MVTIAGTAGQVKIGVALAALSKVPAVADGSPPTWKEMVLLNCSLTAPNCVKPMVGLLIDQLTVLMVTPGAICNISPTEPTESPLSLPGLPLPLPPSFIEHDPARATP